MQPANNTAVVSAPFGSVILNFDSDDRLVRADLSEGQKDEQLGRFANHPAVQKLKRYLAGDLTALRDWPVSSDGTDFRIRVWKAIAKIAPGKTQTYGQLSSQIGSSPRAVGGACGDNPLPIFVPCHRVVGQSSAGGFNHGQEDLPIKLWLLEHEKKFGENHE